MNSPAWNNATGSFTAAYTTSQNGHVYSIDSAGNIYKYDSLTLSWSLISRPTGNPVIAISVGSDGSFGIVDNGGNSYVFSYGSWMNLYIPAMGIAVGDSNNYVVSDYYGTVVESSYGASSYSYGPTKVSATAGLGKICGVDGTGAIYQKSGSGWTSVSGKTLKQVDVSISPSSGAVQICGVDASGDAWTLSGGVWNQITKPTGMLSTVKFVSVEVGTGKIWATFSNGQIYFGTF